MRHGKRTFKVGRNGSHRRSLIANLLKSLVINGKIVTTVTKAKELKRHADKLVTLAKKGDLSSIRSAKAKLMVRYNKLTPKEARDAKNGDTSAYNDDRKVIRALYETITPRFKERQGGYTRITRLENRVGDNAPTCVIEYLEA